MRKGLLGIEPPPAAFKLVAGARLVFADGTPDIVAYPTTRHGWGRLTRLLTAGNLRSMKGGCILGLGDLIRHADDLLLIVLPASTRARRRHPVRTSLLPPPRADPSLSATLTRLAARGAGHAYGSASPCRAPAATGAVSPNSAGSPTTAGVPLLATTDALYAAPARQAAPRRRHLHPRGHDGSRAPAAGSPPMPSAT